MQAVIDANVVISMLIRPGKPIDLLFKQELEIFAPYFLLEELENNKSIIHSKTSLGTNELEFFTTLLNKRINLIPECEFIKLRKKAEEICPHEKDLIYFALALYLKCPIWTNEKRLRKQNQVQIYATHELINLFIP